MQLYKKGKILLRELIVKMWLRLCVCVCDGISCRLKFPSTSNTPDKGRAKQLSSCVMCCPSTCCHDMRFPYLAVKCLRALLGHFPPKGGVYCVELQRCLDVFSKATIAESFKVIEPATAIATIIRRPTSDPNIFVLPTFAISPAHHERN